MWWAIWVYSLGTPGAAQTVYSAVTITFLLRYVSGVDMLERAQKKKAEFRIYMLETATFIPWFQSPVREEERPKLL